MAEISAATETRDQILRLQRDVLRDAERELEVRQRSLSLAERERDLTRDLDRSTARRVEGARNISAQTRRASEDIRDAEQNVRRLSGRSGFSRADVNDIRGTIELAQGRVNIGNLKDASQVFRLPRVTALINQLAAPVFAATVVADVLINRFEEQKQEIQKRNESFDRRKKAFADLGISESEGERVISNVIESEMTQTAIETAAKKSFASGVLDSTIKQAGGVLDSVFDTLIAPMEYIVTGGTTASNPRRNKFVSAEQIAAETERVAAEAKGHLAMMAKHGRLDSFVRDIAKGDSAVAANLGVDEILAEIVKRKAMDYDAMLEKNSFERDEFIQNDARQKEAMLRKLNPVYDARMRYTEIQTREQDERMARAASDWSKW